MGGEERGDWSMGTVGGKAATLRLATIAVENATRGVARAGPLPASG